MVEILRCPACGAADTSKAGPDGAHVCVFCGVRYAVRGGVPQATPPPAAAKPGKKPPSMTILAVAVVILFVGAGVVAAVFAAVFRSAPAGPSTWTPPVEAPIVVAPPVSSEVAAPPPEAPASATFVEHNIRPSGESYWILGVVTNTSPYPLEQPGFDILYLDASGQEVGVGNSYGQSDPLAPGASSPVSLLASSPPKHASHKVQVRAKKLTFDVGMFTDLELKEYTPTRDSGGDWDASGAVKNTGDAPARFVQVVVAAWDEKGMLIGVNNTYAAGEEGLAAGATGRYTVNIDTLDREPKRFTTQVTGRR
jgi:hypothetical protein